tara:strand:+ start:21 stop:329 length:309 start_codon:yes stop_codon:yes gene_type:complete
LSDVPELVSDPKGETYISFICCAAEQFIHRAKVAVASMLRYFLLRILFVDFIIIKIKVLPRKSGNYLGWFLIFGIRGQSEFPFCHYKVLISLHSYIIEAMSG